MLRSICFIAGQSTSILSLLLAINPQLTVRYLYLSLPRVPKFTPTELLKQFRSEVTSRVLSILDYFLQRAVMVVEMLDVSELVSKNAYVLLSSGLMRLVASKLSSTSVPSCDV
jgi:uncharacterized protein YggT (Ycf19 family)